MSQRIAVSLTAKRIIKHIAKQDKDLPLVFAILSVVPFKYGISGHSSFAGTAMNMDTFFYGRLFYSLVSASAETKDENLTLLRMQNFRH